MKRFVLVPLALLAALLLASCASVKPVGRLALLRAELEKWQNFSAEGVVQANHSGLSLRKMFLLSKTADAARLDVVDGGVFGLGPTPLISVYLGPYAAVNSPLFPKLESLAPALAKPAEMLGLLRDPEAILAQYGEEIVANGKLSLGSAVIVFSDHLQIKKISESASGAELVVSHTAKGDPDRISFVLGKNTSVELFVDSLSYGGAEVVPLPAGEASPIMDDLLEVLENILPLGGK